MATTAPLIPKEIPKEIAKPFQVTPVPPLAVLLNPFAWLLWLLDFTIWVITIIGPVKWLVQLFANRGGVEIENGVWRMPGTEKDLVHSALREDKEHRTVYELLMRAVAKFPQNNALGTRTYLGEHKPAGAKFGIKKFGATTWKTYEEFGANVEAFGKGLIKLGMAPQPENCKLEETDGPHTLILYEETCADWITACFGAFSQSIAVATSYATLGISSVSEAVKETNAAAVMCNAKDVQKVASLRCASLKFIVYTKNNYEGPVPESSGALKVLSVEDVIELGKNSQTPTCPAKNPQVAVIMYTSGSTGKPKGVMIKHSSLVSSVAGITTRFVSFGTVEGEETYLAYLPAAHILELVAEITMLCLGCSVGFADPRTISSKGACRQMPNGELNTKPEYPHPPGAIQEFSPTMMAAVPKIWDILKKGVEEVVGKGSPVKRFVFQVAFSGRYCALKQGRDSPLFKALIFSKLRGMLGGNLKAGISGGGPISADVQNFIRVCFAMPLLQGYALTETTCAGTIQMITDNRNGVLGPPVPSVELKIRDCLDGAGLPEVLDRMGKPYLSADTSHYGTPCKGRGEICLRGPSVSAGYFKQPDKTAEVYDAEGWFHSGDIGLVTSDGCFVIVDRLKNLVKLKGGEYIAIEAMEAKYSTSVFVNGLNGGMLCYGDGDMDRPVALVQCNTAELEKWATGTGVAYGSVEALCDSDAARKAVLADLTAAGKAGGLAANEFLCTIRLIPGTGPPTAESPTSPWTPENGGLTASNKLNRKPIQSIYASLLDPMRKEAAR